MAHGSSELVRRVADRDYVPIPRKSGRRISIRVGEMEQKLLSEGFPRRHLNQICTSLEAEKFWKPRGLELRTPKGQPARVDTVLEFVVKHPKVSDPSPDMDPLLELTGILRGSIQEGADTFIRDIRRDKDAAR